MEKVKDLSKVILPDQGMLIEIKKPKRFLILPDGSEDKDSYGIVLAKSPTVKDVEIGDIVVKTGNFVTAYMLGERQLGIIFRGSTFIIVKPDNFIDPDRLTETVSI